MCNFIVCISFAELVVLWCVWLWVHFFQLNVQLLYTYVLGLKYWDLTSSFLYFGFSVIEKGPVNIVIVQMIFPLCALKCNEIELEFKNAWTQFFCRCSSWKLVLIVIFYMPVTAHMFHMENKTSSLRWYVYMFPFILMLRATMHRKHQLQSL